MPRIFFSINDADVISVAVEEDIYRLLRESNDYAYQHFVSLVENNIIQIENDIESVSMSTDNINFSPLAAYPDNSDISDGISIKDKKNAEWTEHETKYLLNQYETYLSMIGPMKRFKTKKLMWAEISKNFFTFFNIERSAIQCENKYKTVIKRKKKAVDNNKTSGAARENVPYEEELNRITAIDDSLEPEVMRDASTVAHKSDSSQCSSVEQKRSRRDNICDTLLKIHQEKEVARERRHQDKLQVLREIGKILQTQMGETQKKQ